MSTPEYGESFLLVQFREFYSEVIRLKQMVHSGSWVFRTLQNGSVLEPDRAANFVWQRLLALLDQQAEAARRRGGDYGSSIYTEAQYVMAALADEVFLHLDWEGKEAWRTNLLESKLFHSHSAGEIFFQNLDRLLQNRDPIYSELARVYLMALSLGFLGKFRGGEHSRELDAYRRKIFSYIARRDPDILDESRRLFPDAYAHTLSESGTQKLPHVAAWIGLLAIVTLVLVAVGHVIWLDATSELNRAIQHILGQ